MCLRVPAELEKNRKFTLTKFLWDAVHLSVIKTACDPTAAADVAAVIIQEGLANVCLLTSSMTHVKQKIESSIPKKGKVPPPARANHCHVAAPKDCSCTLPANARMPHAACRMPRPESTTGAPPTTSGDAVLTRQAHGVILRQGLRRHAAGRRL